MLRQYIRVCSHRAVFRERVEAKSWCRTGPSRARKRHLRTHDAHSARATPRNRTGFMRVGKAPESPPGPHPRKRVEAKSWCRTGRSHARKRHLRSRDAPSARATDRRRLLHERCTWRHQGPRLHRVVARDSPTTITPSHRHTVFQIWSHTSALQRSWPPTLRVVTVVAREYQVVARGSPTTITPSHRHTVFQI